jgi:hypothetical protein
MIAECTKVTNAEARLVARRRATVEAGMLASGLVTEDRGNALVTEGEVRVGRALTCSPPL